MKSPSLSRPVARFGVYELDMLTGELRKQGTKLKLQEQPFQVLLALLERPGEVITREELQKRIWSAETFVDFDHGLNNAIRRLREALGDSAENPRFIETLSRRGYRFISPVTVSDGVDELKQFSSVAPVGHRGRLHWWAIAVVVVVLSTAGFLAERAFRMRNRVQANSGAQIRSLAVLPFANLSGDPAQEYFSDGMTDTLITDLAQISSVRVISRTSTIRYKKTDKQLPDIGRELKVDGIIEGTVQRSGDRVRITAQLIYASEDKHVWANSYDRDLGDVFLLQREVTDDIAKEVRAQVAVRSQSTVQPRPVDQKTLDAYLQGNYHLNLADVGHRDEELRKAGHFFQQAIDFAPEFAPGYIGLAESHDTLWWPSGEDFTIMRDSAIKALQIAPTYSDAHQVMADVKLEDWDWAGAEEECRRAIDLNPNNALAHERLGLTLAITGLMDSAWKEFEIAQQLDPNQDHLSYALFLRGDSDRAIQQLLRMIAVRPEDAVTHFFLSRAYAQQGKHAESIRELELTMKLSGFPAIATRLERSFSASGWHGALRQWAKELEQLMATRQAYFPGVLSEVYAQLGENDKAFYWLEEGARHRHLVLTDPVVQFVKVDPAFAPLRSDPRYKLLLQLMGLQE